MTIFLPFSDSISIFRLSPSQLSNKWAVATTLTFLCSGKFSKTFLVPLLSKHGPPKNLLFNFESLHEPT